MSRNHLIKIDLDGHLRMMEILEPRFDALVEAISEAYRISETAGLTFMYVDVDNDKVRMRGEDNLLAYLILFLARLHSTVFSKGVIHTSAAGFRFAVFLEISSFGCSV